MRGALLTSSGKEQPNRPFFIASRTLPTQPQRIHPPRRIRRVPIRVQPTRQLHRIRRQVAPRIRVVIAVAVVVQPAFGVEVLALETQRLFQLFAAAMGDLV